MDLSTPDQMTQVCHGVCGLVMSLFLGPWMTITAYRFLREQKRTNDKLVVPPIINYSSTHGPFMRGDTQFWALMLFASGVLGDLILIISLMEVISAILS